MDIDVSRIFKNIDNNITIHVITKNFSNNECSEYIRQYKNERNYINTNEKIKSAISKILLSLGENIPNATELVSLCFESKSYLIVPKLISSFSKLFGILEHQANEQKHLDPIILEEGEILPQYINQLVSLNKDIVRPRIIVILKDENLSRAKNLLSGCPHNTNLNLIYSVENRVVCKIINCGAENPDGFLDAFSKSCLSTCSRTKSDVLYNEEWAGNSLVRVYGPEILRIRSKILYSDKTLVKNDLNKDIFNIKNTCASSNNNHKILLAFECMLKLFRVFCNDGGYKDMQDAFSIAKELNNKILLAHVYRNASFLTEYSLDEQIQLMDYAREIFSNNGMIDHAICCKNNMIVRQFYTNNLSINDFFELQNDALNKVPGLVGLSHIHNNTGAALMTKGYYEEAIDTFNIAEKYALQPERCVQNAAISSNKLVAKACCYYEVEEQTLLRNLEKILNNNELLNLPFLSARYVLNIVAIALNQNFDFGMHLINSFPVIDLVQKSLNTNPLGSGQLLLQIGMLEKKHHKLTVLEKLCISNKIIPAQGIREDFIRRTGYNPCSFSMWF